MASVFPGVANLSAQTLSDTVIHIQAVKITHQRAQTEYAINKSEIDSLAIAETLTGSLSELLSKNTPVFIKSYGQGSLATASFRGTAASHTLVEWNGVNISNPMLGQADLSLIPVYFVDEVSLLHGSSSMLSNVGALGGSIHLSTTPGWERRFQGSLMQGFGSFGTFRTYATLGGGNANLQFKVRLAHEQSENNFTYYNNANGLWNYEKQEGADYTMDGLMGEIIYRKDNHMLSGHFWLQGADRNLPPIMSYEGRGREEFQKDLQTRASLKWNYYGLRMKSHFTSGYSKLSLDYFLANQTDGGYIVNYNSHSLTESIYNNYVAELDLSSSTLLRGTLNFNYHVAEIKDETALAAFDADRTESGAGLSIHHQFNHWFSGFALLRGELVDRRLSPVMPSLGMEFQPLDKQDFSIKLNMGRNYHQPTMNDLYWVPGGNPDLLPETGYSGDITLNYRWDIDSSFFIQSTLSGYMTYVDDWIIWQPGEYRFWQAENIKEVFARGFEYRLNSSFKINRIKVDISGNYAFTRTTNESEEDSGNGDLTIDIGKQLIYIPLHKGSAMFHLSYKRYYFSYGTDITGERYTTSSNEETRHMLPAYALHNISAGRSFAAWKLKGDVRLKVDNLFNKDYQAILWRAMPGRSFTLLLKLEF